MIKCDECIYYEKSEKLCKATNEEQSRSELKMECGMGRKIK